MFTLDGFGAIFLEIWAIFVWFVVFCIHCWQYWALLIPVSVFYDYEYETHDDFLCDSCLITNQDNGDRVGLKIDIHET